MAIVSDETVTKIEKTVRTDRRLTLDSPDELFPDIWNAIKMKKKSSFIRL